VKGIYALIIRLNQDICINVGAFGETRFKKGTYVYVGSAQINLEQRVKRHLRKEKRLFWHVDYLLNSDTAKIEKTLFMEGDKAAECKIAQEIGERGESVNGFGCSDCDCRSHLFIVSNYDFLLRQMQPLNMEP
jgi:Uri superfamily endonuclease